MTIEGKLARLKVLAPTDYHAIEVMIEDALRYRWWRIGATWFTPH